MTQPILRLTSVVAMCFLGTGCDRASPAESKKPAPTSSSKPDSSAEAQPANSSYEPISFGVHGIKVNKSSLSRIHNARVYVRGTGREFLFHPLEGKYARELIALLDGAPAIFLSGGEPGVRRLPPAPHYHLIARDARGIKIGPTVSLAKDLSFCQIDVYMFHIGVQVAEQLRVVLAKMGKPRPDDGLEDRARKQVRSSRNTGARREYGLDGSLLA